MGFLANHRMGPAADIEEMKYSLFQIIDVEKKETEKKERFEAKLNCRVSLVGGG